MKPAFSRNSPRYKTAASGGGFRHRYLGGPRFPSRRSDRNNRRILSWLGIIVLALFLAGSVGAAAIFAWVSRDLPDPDNLIARQVAQTTKIYDRTGEHLLYEIHGAEKRTVVTLADIADVVKNATVASEDKDFYDHKGFDLTGIVRAFIKNALSGGRGQGGSTITQQLVKNAILTKEKTYTRKIKELILSMEIERRFTKDQILKMYLNEIPYGSVTYGIESASQSFLGKRAKDLTLSEAALLASIPKASTYYSPLGPHRDELAARAHRVIDVMTAEGMVTAEEAEAAKKDDVLARIKPRLDAIEAPHFVLYVKDILAEKLGETAVETGGLKVITTLDWKKQEIAQKAVSDGLEAVKKTGGSTAAMMAIDPKTGDILAMVGSPDYFDEENRGMVNYLVRQLQPGSSIKPFVYAAAFEQGFTPDTVVYDVRTNFTDPPSEPYVPLDYDEKERGPVAAKEALAGSLNIPTIKVLYLAGIENFLKLAEAAGYTTFADRSVIGLSIGIGANEVKPIEHFSAFTAFANDGQWRPAKAVLRVEDANGRIVIDDVKPTPAKKIMDEETARQVTAILSDNNLRSYIFGAQNWLTLGDRPVAAKTGTTQKFKDAWIVGFTPSLVAGVWTGKAEGGAMSKGADGSRIAAPIWNQFMREILKDSPIETFAPPQPVVTGKPVLDGQKNAPVTVFIDKITGKLATEYTPPETTETRGYFVPHDILFFVDRGDPRGPAPADPSADPQFDNWEAGVVDWAERQGLAFSAVSIPTEKDDIHVPENIPAVSIQMPANNQTIADRQMWVAVNAYAKRGVARVEFSLDGDAIGSISGVQGSVLIPNRVGKGFRTLVATAYDDVGNRASSAPVTVNLTAEAGPLGLTWTNLYAFETVYSSQFPFNVGFRLDDPRSVSSIRLSAVRTDDLTETAIGSISDPTLPSLAVTWPSAPPTGNYTLRLEAYLVTGDRRVETLPIIVR